MSSNLARRRFLRRKIQDFPEKQTKKRLFAGGKVWRGARLRLASRYSENLVVVCTRRFKSDYLTDTGASGAADAAPRGREARLLDEEQMDDAIRIY